MRPHPYHLVTVSPWPLLISISILLSGIGLVGYIHGGSSMTLRMGILGILSIAWLWWRDCIREGTYLGDHTSEVQKGLFMGLIVFIISEILVFVFIFWTYLHSSLSPSVELGLEWPPKGIMAINAFGLPLLNTVILLVSGATVTYSHHGLIHGDRKTSIIGLLLTLLLGLIFTMIQGYEYIAAPFTITDSVYGSAFYLGTGAHGLHVMAGSIFLLISLIRIISYSLTSSHHLGYESAVLYWHLVDVVWLFLFVIMYYWGS